MDTTKVLIEIRGGVVVAVYSDEPWKIECEIVDHDHDNSANIPSIGEMVVLELDKLQWTYGKSVVKKVVDQYRQYVSENYASDYGAPTLAQYTDDLPVYGIQESTLKILSILDDADDDTIDTIYELISAHEMEPSVAADRICEAYPDLKRSEIFEIL